MIACYGLKLRRLRLTVLRRASCLPMRPKAQPAPVKSMFPIYIHHLFCREGGHEGTQGVPVPAQTPAETLTPATVDQSSQPFQEPAVPAVAAPPAAEESAKAQTILPSQAEGGANAAIREAGEAEAAAEVPQAVRLPLAKQAQEQQPPSVELQAEAERGSLPAMAALASGTEAKRGRAQSAAAAVPVMGYAAAPSAGDVAVPGGAAEPMQAGADDDPWSSQRPGVDGGQDPATAAIAALEAAPPAGAQDWDYAALPASVAARLVQIDAENAARMQAPAQTLEAGAAQAAPAEAGPTLVTQGLREVPQELPRNLLLTPSGSAACQ